MPEAFAVLLVFIAAGGVYVGAWLYGRDPANYNAPQEFERLRGHEAWLRQRLHTAQRENWGGDMVARLTAELGVTSKQLAKARGQVGQS